MFQLVDVVGIEPLGGYRLRLAFSDGTTGEHDFAPMVAGGGAMVEPLRDPAFFARVFIGAGGVPAWPNGFDVDAIKLHMDMQASGELGRDAPSITRPVTDYRDIITIEPGKRGGRPCIRGMRIAVADILGWLAAGMSHEEILNDYPELTEADIRASLAYAADRERRVVTSAA